MEGREASPNELPRIPELAEYELVRELGRGGTAVVYLARDRELTRDVAIKLIRPSYVKDEDAVARLEREAHTVGRLQHPNIVMLLGTRRLGDNGLALILQFVPGETLKEAVEREGALSFERVERILRDLGQALAYAHRQRIVHRDIKPQNVYLDEENGLARLADFGIARPWDSDSALTLPGTAIGTPTYMSPEQVDGDNVDGRSDIYSLGLVGHEMLTGDEPWAGESLYSIIAKQKYEPLPSLEEARPGIPANLQRAIEKSLEKNPKDRWRTAEEFLSALSEGSTLAPWKPGEGVVYPPGEARPASSSGGARGRTASGARARDGAGSGAADSEKDRRWWMRAALAASVVVLAGAAAFFSLGEGRDVPGSGLGLFPSRDAVSDGPEPGNGPPDGIGDGVPAEVDADVVLEAEILPGTVAAGGAAARLVALGGTQQQGLPEATLPEPLTVQVTDPTGTPLPDVPVRFEVVAGGGSVGPTESRTSDEGVALAVWTLGTPGSAQRVRAFVEGAEGSAVEFVAQAALPVSARLDVLSGADQAATVGGALPDEVEFRVWDGAGVPLAGTEVLVQVEAGGGAVAPATVVTDALGTARVRWTLGPEEGEQRIRIASVDGGSQATVVARAEGARLPVRAGVVAGGTHSCRMTGAGQILCWGDNENGQLGDQGFVARLTPGPAVTGAEGYSVVAAGISHTCAVDRLGAVHCWGQNVAGQLGDGTLTRRATPAPIAGEERFVSVSAGAGHSCALRADGVAFCWGENTSGQLGDGSRIRRTEPVQVRADVSFRSIVAGWNHTCGLDAQGRAHCWGGNASGESGVAGATSVPVPTTVPGGTAFQAIAAGGSHTCGVTAAGAALCWGSNAFGQIGDGTTQDRSTPTGVEAEEPFASITAGGVHTCAVTREGAARCWGRNSFGQLGDGTQQDRSEPVAVAGTLRFSELRAMGSHTCGSTASGEVFCWGYNIGGQLGDGTRTNRSTPVRVAPGG